jgi:hypothetical protein
VPKVIKMPMCHQHRKQEVNNESDLSNFHPAIVLSGPKSDANLDMITRWISIADQALGNRGNAWKVGGRKRELSKDRI